MSQSLGVPLEALGVLLLAGLAGFVLVSFNSGSLIRAKSLHWLLLGSLALRALAFAGLALFPSWPMVIAMVFLISLGGGGIDSGLNTFISENGSPRQINWLHASFGIGATSGPFLAAGVQAAGGNWNWNFAVVAMFLAGVAFLVWRTAPYWQVQAPSPAENAAGTPSTRLLNSLRLPVVWISTILFFFYVGTEVSAGEWSFSLFTLSRGLPDLAAKFWVGIYWGGFTLVRILFGFVAHRISLDKFLRFALVATSLGAILLWWDPISWVGLAGLVVMGLAEAPIFPSLIAHTPARVGRQHAANSIGFQVAAGGVGGTALSSLVGVLAASINLETIGVSIAVMSLLTLLTYEVLLAISGKVRKQIVN